MIYAKTETERMREAIAFAKKQLEETERKIHECDFVEDVNGRSVYAPNSYSDEKAEFENEKRNWEIMLDILTMKTPFSLLDW